MLEIVGILKIAKESVEGFLSQRKDLANKAWDEVALALDKLSELTTLHIKAVAEVTAPIVNDGDIAETSLRYKLLINNPDFPQGYGIARGILEAARKNRTFQDASTKEKIQAVLDDLYHFQYGVFALGWDSYKVSDAIADCARIASNPQADLDQIARAGDPLVHSYGQLFGNSLPGIPARATSITELISLSQRWCEAWQRYVQQMLYGGRGLNYSIGQLRMQRYT
jgi:hypothetical protein